MIVRDVSPGFKFEITICIMVEKHLCILRKCFLLPLKRQPAIKTGLIVPDV